MKMRMKFLAVVVLAIAFMFGLTGLNVAQAATSPTLGTADSFSILAHTTVTNVPTSAISGDVGLDNGAGGSAYGAGLTSSQVAGTIYATNGAGPDGALGNDPSLMTSARADNLTAFGALTAGTNATCTHDYGAVTKDLVGENLVPGVYCADAFTLSGTLTLSGTTGVWIFKSASSLVTSGTANVVGGDPCNVWWRVVSSATLGTNTSLKGNILASTSIWMASGATLNGRVFAYTGEVTLDNNTISGPTCSSSGDDSDNEDDSDSNHADISVRKRATPSALYSGPGLVTFTYDVRNEGDNALKFVSVKDDKCSPVKFVSGDGNHDSKLDTDERWRYTCTKIVSQTETNTATARGTNGKEVKDTDKATVTVSVPGLPNAGIGPDDNNPWSMISQELLQFFSF